MYLNIDEKCISVQKSESCMPCTFYVLYVTIFYLFGKFILLSTQSGLQERKTQY